MIANASAAPVAQATTLSAPKAPHTKRRPAVGRAAAAAPAASRRKVRVKPAKAPTGTKLSAAVRVPGSTDGAKPENGAATKGERVKLVRDSFAMPKADFELIGSLKQRSLKQGREVKKSELLRAGLHALVALSDTAFSAAVVAIPRLKTGRPHQKKGK